MKTRFSTIKVMFTFLIKYVYIQYAYFIYLFIHNFLGSNIGLQTDKRKVSL